MPGHSHTAAVAQWGQTPVRIKIARQWNEAYDSPARKIHEWNAQIPAGISMPMDAAEERPLAGRRHRIEDHVDESEKRGGEQQRCPRSADLRSKNELQPIVI